MKLIKAILVLGMTTASVFGQGQATPQNAPKPSAAQQKPVAKPAAAVAQKAAVKPVAIPAGKAIAVPVAKAASSKPVAATKPVVKPAAAAIAKAPASTAPAKATASKVASSKPAAKAPAKPAIVASKPFVKPAPATKPAVAKVTAKKDEKPSSAAADAKDAVSVEKAPEPAKNDKTKTISANGRRDPFISPVVDQSAVGSGCSNGKRCLAVDQISLKGVVKAETGMIAVVVNANEKAYFLRENDPVFDGYVLKITTDSIVFKETVQDKLGKPFTKEVTKKINTPVV